MFFLELLIAILVAILLTAIFSRFNRVGPWSGFLWFFLIIFLFSWAGGVWVEPYGPAIRDVYWLPFLFFGLMLAFLLAAVTPPRKPRNVREAREELREQAAAEEAGVIALNVFFFIFIIGAIAALIAYYV
ncbi:MAG: hypothetical protein ACLFQM_06895 [Fidelibacterota bacterium]